MMAESMMEFAGELAAGDDLESGGVVLSLAPATTTVVGSPLGAISPSAPRNIFSQALGVIVGFFAEKWLEAVLGERQGLEILGIFILILILWMMVSDWIEAWWATPMSEDRRIWSQLWVMFVHFISFALVLVVFRYLSVVVGEEWSRRGLGLGEGILQAILFIIYFFFVYVYFLKKLRR